MRDRRGTPDATSVEIRSGKAWHSDPISVFDLNLSRIGEPDGKRAIRQGIGDRR
jgi:hypothetical protein